MYYLHTCTTTDISKPQQQMQILLDRLDMIELNINKRIDNLELNITKFIKEMELNKKKCIQKRIENLEFNFKQVQQSKLQENAEININMLDKIIFTLNEKHLIDFDKVVYLREVYRNIDSYYMYSEQEYLIKLIKFILFDTDLKCKLKINTIRDVIKSNNIVSPNIINNNLQTNIIAKNELNSAQKSYIYTNNSKSLQSELKTNRNQSLSKIPSVSTIQTTPHIFTVSKRIHIRNLKNARGTTSLETK